jgi:hypothetical protein
MTKTLQGSKLEDTENGSEYNGGSRELCLAEGTTMKDAPVILSFSNTRPQTAEIFFEDCLMACVFLCINLIENNKTRFLLHFRNRGYRGYSYIVLKTDE